MSWTLNDILQRLVFAIQVVSTLTAAFDFEACLFSFVDHNMIFTSCIVMLFSIISALEFTELPVFTRFFLTLQLTSYVAAAERVTCSWL